MKQKLLKKLKEKTTQLTDRLDGLVFENEQLREEADILKIHLVNVGNIPENL